MGGWAVWLLALQLGVLRRGTDGLAGTKPPTLREATRMVASLGGFLGRKSDGDPGTKSLWLGLQRVDDLPACGEFSWHMPNPIVLNRLMGKGQVGEEGISVTVCPVCRIEFDH